MCKARSLFITLFFVCSYIQATELLTGDADAASDQTFSFRVQQNKISDAPDLSGTFFYVAAHPDDGGSDAVKEFAVSRVDRKITQFVGLTPEKARVNFSKEDSANPLYDQGIAYMSLFNGEGNILFGAVERPVVVLNNDKKTIYFINSYTDAGKSVQIISADSSTQNIPDANAAVTSGIVQLEVINPYVFAAVGPNGGSFGDVGSGISLTVVGQKQIVGELSFTGPIIADAPTGSFTRAEGSRALSLDISSSEVKIGSNLASIGTIVDMYWHKRASRLYIALQVTGASGASDGARALVVGRLDDTNKMELSPIAATAVFDGSLDKIVGAQAADTQISIHKVREMFTTTALSYVVLVGGVGSPTSTKRTVFALPIVLGTDDQAVNGTIAAKAANVEDLFTSTVVPLFGGRVMKQQATTAAQMPLSTDAATQVGGGTLVNGDITEIFVHGDTVFVSVESAAASQTPGIFYSQALFDVTGKIKGWTTWRRATGTFDKVLSSVLDPITGKISFLSENSSGDVKVVQRTEWKDGDTDGLSPVIASINQTFSKSEAGVQGVNDFVVTSAALDTATPGLLDISLLVATGYKKIYMAETSRVVSGVVVPNGGTAFGPFISYANGEITQTFPVNASKQISVEGGALDDIGAIVTAEVARDGAAGSNGWLFVGGDGGVAVLSKADGSGWNTTTGLSVNFTGLTAGMAFKRVGDYQRVRRLIQDDQYLYVLTEEKLDRIDLTQGTVGLGTILPTTIATTDTVPGESGQGSLFDVVISEKLAIVATSNGLLRLDNGLDIRSVGTESASWQLMDTPEGAGPVRQLVAVTQTGRVQDIARKSEGGNLYALSAYRGKNKAELFRYEIQQIVGSVISDTTVRRIPDLFVQNISSYFASFGLFRNLLATDGSLFFGTRGEYQDESSMVTVLHSQGGIHTGSRFLSNKEIPIALSESSLIASMIQSSATGSWLVAGDHGIQANE